MALIPVLSSLGQSPLLAQFLPRFYELLTQLSVAHEVSALDARNMLARGLGDERASDLITELFGDADLNQATVFRIWSKLFDFELTAEDRSLLATEFGGLEEGTTRELTLPLFGVGSEIADPPSNKIDLLLAAGTTIELALKAGAVPPGGSAPDSSQIAVGLKGTIGGMASLGLAMPPVAVLAQNGADYSHTVEYFLRWGESRTFGQEAVRGLDLIRSNPRLRVRSLIHLLTNPGNRVEAIQVTSNQAWRFAGTLSLGRQAALGGGNGLDLGIEVGFNLIERGEYQYSLTAAPNGLDVAIHRLDRAESTSHESVGVELDLRGLAQKLYPKIRDHLGSADKALQQLLEFLPDQDVLRTTLTRHIEKALADFTHKDLVMAAIGLDPTQSSDAAIAARLSALIERTPMLWQDKTAAVTEAIIDDVLGRIDPLTPDTRAELKESLQNRLRSALVDLDKAIKEKVLDIVNTSEFDSVRGALRALGDDISDRITSIDGKVNAVTGKVRDHVGRYQAFIAKLSDYLDSAAARRILLKLRSEEKRIRSEEAVIRLRFNPDAPNADEYLRRLLLSDVEALFVEARKGDTDGPVIALNAASLTRYAGLIKTRSFEAVLLGFEMGGKSILETETTIVEDAAGNLTVATKMNYQEVLKSVFDQRRFQIINAYQLANSRQTGSATLAFSVFREAAGLEIEDIKAFAWGCERLGMISRASYAAIDVLEEAAADLDFKRSRLNIGLTLTQPQLEQLLSYGAPVSTSAEIPRAVESVCLEPIASVSAPVSDDEYADLRPEPRRDVPAERPPLPVPKRMSETVDIACRAFEATLKFVEPSEPSRKLLQSLFEKSGYTGTIGEAIRDFPGIAFNTESDGFSVGGPLYRAKEWLYYRNKAVTELAAKGLLGMWAIYHSGPQRWPKERYERCQERSGEIIGYWFDRTGSQAWYFGIEKNMRPVSLALLRTLLDLADTDRAAPGPLLAMDLQLLNEDAKVVKTLPISA